MRVVPARCPGALFTECAGELVTELLVLLDEAPDAGVGGFETPQQGSAGGALTCKNRRSGVAALSRPPGRAGVASGRDGVVGQGVDDRLDGRLRAVHLLEPAVGEPQAVAAVADHMVQVYLGAYRPGDAAQLLTDLRAYAERCKTFTGKSVDGKPIPMTVTLKPVPGLGDEAFDMKKVPTGPYSSDEIVVTRIGDRVLFLSGDDILGRLPNIMQLAVPLVKSIK